MGVDSKKKNALNISAMHEEDKKGYVHQRFSTDVLLTDFHIQV